MYYKRDIEKSLNRASKSFQAITIYGSRQVGKTTTVTNVFKDFNFVTLDDGEELDLALSNPKKFLEMHKWPLIIDEVQKASNLFSYIKIIIDEQRIEWMKNNQNRQLMYVLTGSNQFELQNGISESLAGRTAVLDMGSMTQLEALKIEGNLFKPDIKDLLEKENKFNIPYTDQSEIFERIFRGGMPDIVTGESERDMYFRSYIDTYIEKDVRKIISASSEMQFRRFLSYLALRTSQSVSYEVFARELGIDSQTIKRWLSILETSGIIILLEPYMANLSNRIIKAPKLYFMDTGLCAYLCKWPNAEMLRDCAMGGAFFETFVVSEIFKSFYNHAENPKFYLYYYRDIDKKEVDLLYIEGNSIYPIEVKKGIFPNKPTKNFNVLKKYNMEIKPGLVIDCTDKIRPINDNAYTFPVYLLGI